MAPSATCTTHSAATTKKYFTVARCEGVGLRPSKRIALGQQFLFRTVRGCEAKYQTMPPTPASSSTKLTTLQTIAPPVGWLPISGSCGQFCV